jgi:hypothetical protein
MTIIDELLKRDLKKEPILLVNKRLNKYRNSEIPNEKRMKVENLLSNSNLHKVIEKERITKP